MKKYLFLIILCIIGFFLPIPDYVELNHLMIVDSIGLDCSLNEYHLYFKEILPKGGDGGIQYDYKIHLGVGENIKASYDDIVQNTHKKIFLDDTNTIITNCISSEKLIHSFSLHPKNIIHTNKDIKKELK